MSSSPQAAGNKPLRLLALDGGGVKGLTSLLILRRLMVQLKRDPTDPGEDLPRPCEVFDLIGGTSTGGLIAIMLGRLGMTVDECIETYKTVGKSVFGKKKPLGMGRTVFSGSMYKTKDLQTAIKTLVEERLKAETPLEASSADTAVASNSAVDELVETAPALGSATTATRSIQEPKDAPLNDIKTHGVTGYCRM
jgi:hypothetical protein